jgi:hypothetical protein
VRKPSTTLLLCNMSLRCKALHACRIVSDSLLVSGFGQLELQHVAKQLTSVSLALSPTAAEACWQSNAEMLAALAQLSELRHLDVGNCKFVPTDGAFRVLPPVDLGNCM